jgi:predicted lipoprotein with Yx(FWY)xxD motif
MRRLAIPVIVIVASTAVAAAAASPKRAPVLLGQTPLGHVLTDAHGRTLYLFGADRAAKSSCYAQCAAAWPPYLTTGRPLARHGVKQSLLTTTKRKDGTLQVVYRGHPLYFFSGDRTRGAAKGQNVAAFGAKWAAVTGAGAAVSDTGNELPPTTTDPGYGGGYGP